MKNFTLPKQLRKRYRKIVVNEELYAWKIGPSLPTGFGYGMTILHVKSKTSVGAFIEPRANQLVSFNSDGKKSGTWILSEKFTITPSHIRKVIIHAINNGWEYASDFSIDVHKEIPISEHIEFSFPILSDDEVVVIGYERNEDQTLKVLNHYLIDYIGKESFYNIFSDQKSAEKYMMAKSLANQRLIFWMANNTDNALAKVALGNIIHFKK